MNGFAHVELMHQSFINFSGISGSYIGPKQGVAAKALAANAKTAARMVTIVTVILAFFIISPPSKNIIVFVIPL